MTQEEIFDYNKRCAEFLKLEILPTSSNSLKYKYKGYEYYLHKLEFHSDWNCIMEIVEAIDGNVKISKGYCRIITIDFDITINAKTKEAVVQAINQFLI